MHLSGHMLTSPESCIPEKPPKRYRSHKDDTSITSQFLTRQMWLNKRLEAVNGVVSPSLVPRGYSPKRIPIPYNGKPPQDRKDWPVKCSICGDGFKNRVSVRKHFPVCVERNGNPEGKRWHDAFECDQSTWHYKKRSLNEPQNASLNKEVPEPGLVGLVLPSNIHLRIARYKPAAGSSPEQAPVPKSRVVKSDPRIPSSSDPLPEKQQICEDDWWMSAFLKGYDSGGGDTVTDNQSIDMDISDSSEAHNSSTLEMLESSEDRNRSNIDIPEQSDGHIL
ncbi:uncharacterized protein KY384_007363 [Bacidia gigantensis]|uniref:uncharacterized protein n=1 Tax=Bacidia gigantensis TaxID=2732470 RepID=UPI001D051567|nr:uncharacterized protein KY384_007363 [Bacidia gigantensis]KAG8528445.1 hypothetical protein KY384_007363 [Bacidia gigantensis]